MTDVKKIIIVNWYKIQKFGRLYQNPSQCSNPLTQNLDSWEFILVNYWKDNRSSVLRGLLLHFLIILKIWKETSYSTREE